LAGAAFFAVAISVLLDQVEIALPVINRLMPVQVFTAHDARELRSAVR
jgi:hypothetical protein